MENEESAGHFYNGEFNKESESGNGTDEEAQEVVDENILKASENDLERERCPICLNRFREQDIGTPESCYHDFCLECIQEWSKSVNTCPIDRQIFTLILCKHPLEHGIFKEITIEHKVAEDEEPTYCELCCPGDKKYCVLLRSGCDIGFHKVPKNVFDIDNDNIYTKQNVLVYTAHRSSQVPNKDGEKDDYDPAHPTDDLELENKLEHDLKSKTLDNEYDPAHPTDELNLGDQIWDNGAMETDPNKKPEHSSCKNVSPGNDRNGIQNSYVIDNDSKVGLNDKKIDDISINAINESNPSTPGISKTTNQPMVSAHSSGQSCHTRATNGVSRGSNFNLSHNSFIFSKPSQCIKPFEISRRARFERRGLYGGEIDFTEDVDLSEGAFPDSFEVKTKKIQAVFKDTKLKPDNAAETKSEHVMIEHSIETMPSRDGSLVTEPHEESVAITDGNLSNENSIMTVISKESNLAKESAKKTVSTKNSSLLKEQSEEALSSENKCLNEQIYDKPSVIDKKLVMMQLKDPVCLNETFCVKDLSKDSTSFKDSNVEEILVKTKMKLDNKEIHPSSEHLKPLSLKSIESKNAVDNWFKPLKDSDPDIGISDEEDPIHEMRKHEKELDVEFGKTDFSQKNNEKKAKRSKRNGRIDTKSSDKGKIKHKDEVKKIEYDSEYLYQKDSYRKDYKKHRKKSAKKKIKADKNKIEEGEYIENEEELDRIVIQVSQDTGNRTVWKEAEVHRSDREKKNSFDWDLRKAKKRKRHKSIEKRSRSLTIDCARSGSKEGTHKKRKDYKERSKSRSQNRSSERTHKKRKKMKKKRSRDQSRSRSHEIIRDWSRERNQDERREVSRDRNKHDFIWVEDRSPGKMRYTSHNRDRSPDSGKNKKRTRDKSDDRVDIFGRSKSPLFTKRLIKEREIVVPFVHSPHQFENENKYSDSELPENKIIKYDNISSIESNKTLDDKEIEIEEGEIVSHITVKEPTVREKVISVEIDVDDDEFDQEEPEETEQFQYTDRDEYLSQSKSKQQRQNLIEIGFSENRSDVMKVTELMVKSTQPSSPVRPPLPEPVTIGAPFLPPIPDLSNCPPPGPPPGSLPGLRQLGSSQPLSHPAGPHLPCPHQPDTHQLGPQPGHQLAPHQVGLHQSCLQQTSPHQPGLDPGRMLIPEHPLSFPVQVNLPQGQGMFTDRPLLVPAIAPALEPRQSIDIQHKPSFTMDLNMLPPPGFNCGLPPTIAPQRPLILSPMNDGPPHLPGLVSPRFSWQVSTSEVINNNRRLAPPAANQHTFEGLQPHAEDLPSVSLQRGNLHMPVNSHDTSRHIMSVQSNKPLHDVPTSAEELPIHLPPLCQESKQVHVGPDPRVPPLRLPIPLLPTTTDLSSMCFVSSISNNSSRIAASRMSVCETDYLTTTTNILNSVTSILGLNKIDDTVKIPVQNVPLLHTCVIAPDMCASETQKADRQLTGLEKISEILQTQMKLINSSVGRPKQTQGIQILNTNVSTKLKDNQIFKVPLPPGGKFIGTNSESEGSEVVDMEIGSPIDDEVSIELPVSPQFDNLIDNPADLLEKNFNEKINKTYHKDTDCNSLKTLKDGSQVSNSKELTEVKDVIKSNDKKQKQKENKHHRHRENKPNVKKEKLTIKKEHKRKALKDAQIDLDTRDIPISAVDMAYKEKYLKKLHMQERAIEEVKMALKPHYANKEVTKDQYKDILRRAVPKICHSKSGNINPMKIKSLVQAYVEKLNKKHTNESDLINQSSMAVKS